MALINRISRLVKADFNAVLDHIEEPEQLLKQAIRDMDDELVAAEQRIVHCAREQELLAVQKDELETAASGVAEQLDLCFASGKDDLARKLIRKKLENERLLKRLVSELDANASYLDEQRATLAENRSTLQSLQQKAELFAQRVPARSDTASAFDDIAWMSREMNVGDDEVEIAYLSEKNRRADS